MMRASTVAVVSFWLSFPPQLPAEAWLPLDGPASEAIPIGKPVGHPICADEVPGKFVYDPLAGRSRLNKTSVRFRAEEGIEVPLNAEKKATGSFTLEAFVKASDPKQHPVKPERFAPTLRLRRGDQVLVEAHIAQSRPPHSYPWWQACISPSGKGSIELSRNVYKGFTHVDGDSWRHVAVVYNDSTKTASYYHDYTLLDTRPLAEPLVLDDANLILAGPGHEASFAGWLDEVRLTDRPLPPHQFLRACDTELRDVSFESTTSWLPREAGYIDLRVRYGAVGDGKVDDTAAFRRAFRELADRVPLELNTLYIPNGIYRVTDTIAWTRFLVVQGESRAGVVIKLDDKSPGFQKAQEPRPVVACSNWNGGGGGSGSAIENYLFDVTISTGRNNPGAIGLDYHSNNIGCVERVTVRSEDTQGVAGISMLRPWPGPALLKHVDVAGFDTGIDIGHREYSMTLEDIRLVNQRQCGVRNRSNILAIRGLVTVNIQGPAVLGEGSEAMLALLDSHLSGEANNCPAIRWSTKHGLFVRNVRATGYQRAIDDGDVEVPGLTVDQYVSGPVQSLSDPAPRRSLNLPIEETPEIEWSPETKWVSIAQFADDKSRQGNWAPALQAAIDSGATHLYLPANQNYTLHETVHLRGKVQAIAGMKTTLRMHESQAGKPALRYDGTDAQQVVVLDRLDVRGLVHASPGTLSVRHGTMVPYTNEAGCGKLFIEDQGGADYRFDHPQRVWARQWNVESHEAGPCITSRGATIWALGFKTEYESQKLASSHNAQTEILGAFIYPIGKIPEDRPIFSADNARLSLVYGTSIYQSGHQTHIREVRSGKQKVVAGKDVPFHGSRQKMSLYVSGE